MAFDVGKSTWIDNIVWAVTENWVITSGKGLKNSTGIPFIRIVNVGILNPLIDYFSSFGFLNLVVITGTDTWTSESMLYITAFEPHNFGDDWSMSSTDLTDVAVVTAISVPSEL